MIVRQIIPDLGTAVLLSAIERAAFAGRETPWSINDYIALGQSDASVVLTDDAIREGYLILSIAADEAEVINLGVIPRARGHGLGRALLAAGEKVARGRGVTRMFLEVAEDNRPALALYETGGYREVGRRKGYYARPDGTRVGALILGKDLGEPEMPT